jgi:hypothetical protein
MMFTVQWMLAIRILCDLYHIPYWNPYDAKKETKK